MLDVSGIDPGGVVANALSIPPGEYGRKAKTQRNWRGPAQVVEQWFNSTPREEPYLGWNPPEVRRDVDVPARELDVQVLHGCRQLVS